MTTSKLRVIRSALVVVVNGGLLYSGIINMLETRARQQSDPVLHFQAAPLTPQILWLAPLAIGIVFEFTSFRLAWFVNVGYHIFFALYCIAGLFFAVAHVLGFSEGEHWIVLVVAVAIPEVLFVLLLFWLSRRT